MILLALAGHRCPRRDRGRPRPAGPRDWRGYRAGRPGRDPPSPASHRSEGAWRSCSRLAGRSSGTWAPVTHPRARSLPRGRPARSRLPGSRCRPRPSIASSLVVILVFLVVVIPDPCRGGASCRRPAAGSDSSDGEGDVGGGRGLRELGRLVLLRGRNDLFEAGLDFLEIPQLLAGTRITPGPASGGGGEEVAGTASAAGAASSSG